MSATRKNIVIIGAGYGGLGVWAALKQQKLDESEFDVVLINPSPDHLHRISAVRAAVTTDGNFHERSWAELDDKKFNQGTKKLVVGSAVSIEENEDGSGSVILDNGKSVPYVYLVIATGSSWEAHLNYPSGRLGGQLWAKTWHAKFEKAESIVLVGGGVISIETAGEIKEFFPHKKVTIVHGQELLLNEAYPRWWRERIDSRVRALGIELVLSDYVDDATVGPDGTVSTRKGHVLNADLVIPTRGPKPITSFVASLGKHSLSEGGYVKVSPTLQLPSHPNVFAVGDVVEWKEQKQAVKAMAHANIVAKNIVALTKGQAIKTTYKGSSEMIVITLGKSQGYGYIGLLGGFSLPSWLSTMLKSKDLMVKGELKV